MLRAADGIRSDGGRNPIGRRTESDQTADAAHRINQKKATLSIGKRGFFVYVTKKSV